MKIVWRLVYLILIISCASEKNEIGNVLLIRKFLVIVDLVTQGFSFVTARNNFLFIPRVLHFRSMAVYAFAYILSHQLHRQVLLGSTGVVTWPWTREE